MVSLIADIGFPPNRCDHDTILRTLFNTAATAGAAFLDYLMCFFFHTCNRIYRASPGAGGATGTAFLINPVMKKRFTNSGSAILFVNMFFVFSPEIADRAEHRVRASLAETTKGAVFDTVSQLVKGIEVFRFSFTFGNPV
jgi:hypothetical protein